ncbi:hypothetical protein ILUMI_04834 [Ignelater luminosus]|uniref:Uncharacterized protein n=1 Tax=Ignelater luminosus TaxID=2038154 RepID=A0A8K0DD39_IGNLU|nr:hypothetical protein ILUMI_04834 [Ignelater luminosus]
MLEEVLQILNLDDLTVDRIYVEPPESHSVTDEESGDEEDSGDVNHLPSRQLVAPAEIVLSDNNRIGGTEDNAEISQENIEEYVAYVSSPKIYSDFSWIKEDLCVSNSTFTTPDYSEFVNKAVIEIFDLFFDDEVIQFLIEPSKIYA